MHADDKVSRRRFLKRSAAGVALFAAGGGVGIGGVEAARAVRSNGGTSGTAALAATATPLPTATPVPSRYTGLHSRPDLINAPTLKINARNGTPAPGYIFLTPTSPAPQGAAIFDSAGHLIWYRPGTAPNTLDLQVVQYQGTDTLGWWEGDLQSNGFGDGSCVLYDQHYQTLRRITAGGGTPLDLHEFQLTARNTTLVAYYRPLTKDLTAMNGAPNTTVLDCVVQEIDLASGKVLLEWHSLDHVALEESALPPPAEKNPTYDYFHVNAITVDTADENLVISARNTSALYKLKRSTGEIIWRLRGGDYPPVPKPQLTLLPVGETFWFQHDVRCNADGTISVFDDGGSPHHHNGRGLVMRVDETTGTATIVQEYGSSLAVAVQYQGSFRVLPGGHTFLGWGDVGRLTEFNADGSTCLDATFTGNSYRALKFDWKGNLIDAPAIAAARSAGGVHVWASWNGATEVRQWRVLGGADANSLVPLAVAPWQDFETDIAVNQVVTTYAVEALDALGRALARSSPAPLT
jgi:Arylsulfotransferase (ASST)